ncbi:hypothetical protein LFL96_25305 [Paraburkholderia sp. D15]|uniref:hypothetical protein n=1 Tax=Paraburkholderia sp. D15 TaxID=2880218 RepID=UPI00247A5117|nr:hypothetical protein [Paraburkholderia sp. D15]WGS54335.1 hypothetical protein LFL96_25305 [Paraburkholderia sp. D15]WKF60112.1 hypothetical protein HUO10_004624 [Paraburkholderia busanensis]
MIKNPEIASDLSNRFLGVSGAINDAIILVQESCPADEFKAFRRAMGQLLDQVYVLALEPLYEAHPDIAPPELEFKPRGKGR